MNIDFLYHNGAGADTILLAAHSMMMLVSLLFLIAVALLVKHRFRPLAALFTTVLSAFDPNLIADGRYVLRKISARSRHLSATFQVVLCRKRIGCWPRHHRECHLVTKCLQAAHQVRFTLGL
jgi:hypothetical protein